MTTPHGNYVTTVEGAFLKLVIAGQLSFEESDDKNLRVFYLTHGFVTITKRRHDKTSEENVVVLLGEEKPRHPHELSSTISGNGTMKSPVVLEASSEDDSSSISLEDGSTVVVKIEATEAVKVMTKEALPTTKISRLLKLNKLWQQQRKPCAKLRNRLLVRHK